MALWLGAMRLAEQAGLVQRIARGLRPIMRRLFPNVPPEHPAMGSMVMNMSANMLGLGNAPTPLGAIWSRLIRGPAWRQMRCAFFWQLTPALSNWFPRLRSQFWPRPNRRDRRQIVGTALLATLCAASVAIISVKLLEKLPIFRISRWSATAVSERGYNEKAEIKEEAGVTDPGYSNVVPPEPAKRLSILGLIALIALALFFLVLFVRMVASTWFGVPMTPEAAAPNVFVRSVNALSILAIPFLLSFFPLYAAARSIKVYDEFVEGAKQGFGVILKIIPFLVTMLVAIGMFKGAGGIDLLSRLLSPILTPLQFPTDPLPLALMRPLSGSATLALVTDIVHCLGPDNIVSLTAATIYGSTETTFTLWRFTLEPRE